MNRVRRIFLQSAGWAGGVVLATGGMLKSFETWAASWNKPAFEATSLSDTLKGIGATGAVESRDIAVKAPEIAENGAVVPVEVTSRIPDTRTIAIVVEKNPTPLVAEFDLANGAESYVSTRIKMGETSKISAIVKAGDKVYVASKEVKVTIGGCGG
jgi:sulfur-oxidizing protein SoxY